MRTLKILAVIPLLPLVATATFAASGPAFDSYPSIQEDTGAPDAPDQRSEREKGRHRGLMRFHDRDGEPFAWSFGDWGPRGYLGVGVIRLTLELREHFGAPADRGVMVSKVVGDSPAAAAGIVVGDILLAIDGEAIDGEWDLIREIGRRGEGETVSIEVQRDGTTFSVTPALEVRDRQVVDLMPMLQHEEAMENLERLHELRFEIPDFDIPDIDAEEMQKVIAIRDEDIERAMQGLRKRLDSPEFRQRIAEATRRSAELERRTAELERRLAELQRQIAGLQSQQDQ